ncbi:MAG: efflux RND transporter permease subunit, partial [Holophagales bacterium]|nr:efflux RND transporter permease subunit [Holophagales bacterium]
MNLAETSIRNRLSSIIVMVLALSGGWSAYQSMPRFEDPEFTIRIAQIFTQYPGASPEQVAEEVTEPLETAIQQLQEVKSVESVSSAGVSEIKVEIKYEFSRSKSDLSIVWAKLRNKIKDAERALPPGVASPAVYDDFGDVYGLLYLLTGDGYSPAELKRYAKSLQKALLQVPGVAKVALDGDQREAIYVEISRQRAAALGVTQGQIFSALGQQSSTNAAGTVPVADQRLLVQTSGAVDSVAEIENLLVATAESGRLVYLKDIADVRREYQSPPTKLIRYNGRPALALGISNVTGSNVAAIGEAVQVELESSESLRPLGMELHEFYHQGKIVEAAVGDFVVNVVAAVAIVFVTLLVFMGLRSGLIIGAVLVLIIA